MLADVLAAVASVTAFVPAAVRAARYRGVGLSLSSQGSAAVLSLSWLLYCLGQGLLLGAVSSAFWAALGLLLSVRAFRDGHGSLRLPLLVGCSVAAIWVVSGPGGVALLLGLAPLVSDAPQLRSLLRQDAAALSLTAYGIGVVRAAAWLPYGVSNGDVATVLWASCSVITALATAALLFRHRHAALLRRSRSPRAPGIS